MQSSPEEGRWLDIFQGRQMDRKQRSTISVTNPTTIAGCSFRPFVTALRPCTRSTVGINHRASYINGISHRGVPRHAIPTPVEKSKAVGLEGAYHGRDRELPGWASHEDCVSPLRNHPCYLSARPKPPLSHIIHFPRGKNENGGKRAARRSKAA